jgi:serine/threonine protein kinase/uncharacterized protein YgiM (DUF1202 family)
MAENDNDKTTTYRDSEKNKTETYNSKQDETAAYSELQNREFKSKTHGIGVGDKINLRGNDYSITGIISEGTGEAVIYKVEDSSNKTLVVKLYFEFTNSKEEPNFETLKRIKEVTDPDILKLHDFGVGADKYQGKYCYEISDYAEGGDLFAVADFKAKYTKDFIENNIVPEILHGIRKLHEFKIYHCDLKPSNIFFKDKNQTDLLIGDYGSAKAYDIETEKEIRKTSTVKGTETYLAPEQPRGIISERNDYYSFGIILLHLLYPEQFSKDNNPKQVDKIKYEKIVERQYNSQPVVDFNPANKRLNNLIEGLTLINHLNRFGKTEVEKWLNGEEVPIRYFSETTSIHPISISKNRTIKTEKDLIAFFKTQSDWRDELIDDKTTNNDFFRWLDNIRGKDERNKVKELINFYTIEDSKVDKQTRESSEINYAKEALLRYFDPEREIRIKKKSFNFFTTDNIKKDIEAYILSIDDIWKSTSLEEIRFYIFQLEFSIRQLFDAVDEDSQKIIFPQIEKLRAIAGIKPRNPIEENFHDFKTEIQTKINSKDEAGTFRLLTNLFYAFNPDRTFRDSKNNSIKKIDDLGILYVQGESSFADKYLKIEKERFLQKLNKTELNSLDYKQFIFEVFKDKAEAQVELVKLTFDKHRDYKVNYKFYKSLNTFLSQKNISNDFTSRSDANELYENRRSFFQSFKSECENFVSTVTDKHNIATLTDENLSQIRKKFSRDSWKRHLYIYSGQFLALLIAIPLGIIIYGLATHQLHVDNNWRFNWGANSNQIENTLPTVTHNFYKTITDANVRADASEYSSLIAKANTGQEVEVLETSNSKWYKVNYNGTIGFISSKLLSYSRSDSSPNTYNSAPSSNNSNVSTSTNNDQPSTTNNDNSNSNNTPQTSTVTETPTEPVKEYKWVTCSDCRGNGTLNLQINCTTCNGVGSSQCNTCHGNGNYSCNNCYGTGFGPIGPATNWERRPCKICSGTEKIKCNICASTGKVKCETCSGTGKITKNGTCPKCNGKGQVQVEI